MNTDLKGGRRRGRQPPACERFTGEMAAAFKTLTNEMYKKGSTPFVNYGKFKQNYREAADELKKAEDFNVIATNQALAQQLKHELTNAVAPVTPSKLAPTMQKMLEMGSNYLAQHAEFNKDKGPAFNLLVKEMQAKGNEPFYQKDKTKRTYKQAAKELDSARYGLEATHDDPNLSQEICAKLAQMLDKVTPPEMKSEMKETVDLCSKYLSESAVNEGIRARGGVVTEEGFYIDEHGRKQRISPEDAPGDFYIDEDGIRRKKKPGEETYVDAQGIRRLGKGPGSLGMAAPVTEEGFYIDENGNKIKINPSDAASDFYIDEKGIRRKKKPGQETYVDAQGIRRLGKPPGPVGMAAPVTEEGFYIDENGNKIKINPSDAASDFYIDEKGIRRKKKPGQETYVDAQGIRRLGKPPGPVGMAAPVTEEGFYIDENGNKIKINPSDAASDFYIDEKGIRRKKKPGEETYVDAQGIRRLGKPPGSVGMAAPVTEEGFYIDENGNKIKISPSDAASDFYIDEKGIRRKKKPGQETYVDAQGIRRLGKPPGSVGMAAPVTEEGFYIDENGNKIKISPSDAASDFYIDEKGIRRKKKPGQETYVDAQGIRRLGKPPGSVGMAAPVTEEGFYIDENGNKIKINPSDAASDFYIDEKGIRRKKKPGQETYVDAQGIRRLGKPPGSVGMAAPVTEEGFYIDENGNKIKISPSDAASDFYIDEKGIRRKKKPGQETYVDAQGIRRLVKPPGSVGMAAPVTEEGFYIDENGNKIKISPSDAASDFYIDEKGIRRKKKPGQETYVDAQGIRRLGKPSGSVGMAAPVTEEGFYIDENGNKIKINPSDAASDFYIDEKGIRRKKKPGQETYVDAQGIRRLGKPPGSAGAAATVTEEGFYIDENGNKIKINPSDAASDFYIDEKGIRRKKKPGQETYVDAQGIRRLGKPPGSVGMAAPVTEEGFYIDENGNKIKISPSDAANDFYIDEKGIRRKKKPGQETYVDAQGIRRLGKPPGSVGMAAPVTEEGFYIDENGNKIKISPSDAASDFYIDEKGIRRKKKPGEETYVDAQGIRRKGKPPGAADGAVPGGQGRVSAGESAKAKVGDTTEGYYIDENGNKRKIKPGDNPDDYYIDAQGNRRRKKSGAGDEQDEHAKRKRKGRGRGEDDESSGDDMETDPDRAAALGLLHQELRGKGSSPLYKQPHTELTYEQASKWLKQRPRTKIDKTVKESGDTARLHKKFERKLGELTANKVPPNLQDAMQDVIIESSRILSEYFVAKNYKALVTDGLIAEMQKKGNEILVEVGDGSETFFFAAQRLKKAKSLETDEPCDRISYFLTKQLDDMIRSRSMARKVIATMKEHIKDASEYLSEHVTKPDEDIEAYVALLGEMEATGDALLFEGNIPKSYKSCAAYLRGLTSDEDQINRSDMSLKSATESKLNSIMSNVVPHGYTKAVLSSVISKSAGLLVSYILLQGEKTEALKTLIDELATAGPLVLLRHGTIRKTYNDGADILRGKNADQLSVTSADPVVARKIQLKLISLMRERTPDKYKPLMHDVIEDVTMYLANYLLQPRMIQVCKCMKNVFVQCELWCDEILRRVTRPCCTCSRHVSAQALAELAPGGGLHFAPGSTRAFGPGLEVSVTQCPSGARSRGRAPAPCPAPHPTPGCNTASYMLYSASYRRRYMHPPHPPSPTRIDSLSDSLRTTPSTTFSPDPKTSYVAMYSTSFERRHIVTTPTRLSGNASSRSPDSLRSPHSQIPRRTSWETECEESGEVDAAAVVQQADSDSESDAVRSSNGSAECEELYWRMPTSMFGTASYSQGPTSASPTFTMSPTFPESPSFSCSPSFPRSPSFSRSRSASRSPSLPPNPPYLHNSTFPYSPSTGTTTRKHNLPRNDFGTRTPIISTDQMSDWHAMMVSLMWNVQAWRDWIQENIDRALSHQPEPNVTKAEADDSWADFQRKVSTEGLQWRQYNLFSRQLTLRLAVRYKDKHIVSPTRATNRTETYTECQHEMLEIIEMFNRWTQWLAAVVKETNSITNSESEASLHEIRWHSLKMKVEEYSKDWDKYNLHLKVCWEQKYRTLIAEWLPAWKQPGPVWVVSACGAVPSGAVAAGIYDSEVAWVARTTHRCNVLPGALHPSKHCCIVYADGAVHHYTKYQVMCNAKAVWMPWRAGSVGARAVRVAPGVHAGRVLYRGAHLLGAVHAPHYRCHVVIFGRPFAFNCYELLVLPEEE